MSEVFDRIYRTNAWAGDESRSGPGSGTHATNRVAVAIVDMVEELGIQSVLDVGCGDGYWMPRLPGYRGIDVSAVAIGRARRRHPDWDYRVDDGGSLPQCDLVILRDVIQHLPLAEGDHLLDRVVMSFPRYLLASTYRPGSNVDVPAGSWYSPDMTAMPFDMGPPIRMLLDGYHYHETDELRDPAKHLGLWRVRLG